MTTEEKARAYDEALTTAKRIISENCSEVEKLCLKCVFPELAESEDERTRKFLVDFFASYKIGDAETKLNGVRIDDILAYLEKQKNLDKMIVVSPEVWDKAISDAYENGKKDCEKQKEQKHPNGCFTCDEYKKGYEEGRRNGFTAGYDKAMKEVEQKEQKPVVTHGETYHVDTLGTQQVIAGKMPQKPAEWSEEDEDAIRGAIGILLDDNNPNFAFPEHSKLSVGEIVKRLKSLPERFNLVPKPEWSEEDEMAFGDLMWCINQAAKSAKDENDMGNIWFAENWVKNRLKSS